MNFEKNVFFETCLREKILSYNPDFDEEILEKGLRMFQIQSCSAGYHLFRDGDVSDKLFITEKSITRNYLIQEDGEEKTIWIEPEMHFVTDFESFTSRLPSLYNIHLYEDSDVYFITNDNLEFLFQKYHQWALFGIKILEQYLIYTFKITNTFLFNDAMSNYLLLERSYKRFFQVVPLKHIASRLGISPITISRIRSERFKK